MKMKDKKGYTLVELLVVIAIIAILSAVSTGIYRGYVEKARTAKYYEIAHQIRQALSVCELEYGDEYGLKSDIYQSDAFFRLPNEPESVLYPYVGESTADCTNFTLKLKKVRVEGVKGDRYRINGFTYETDSYLIHWTDPDEIKVERK